MVENQTNVAIVGSEEKYWKHEQKNDAWFHIMDILEKYVEKGPTRLVSGGCHKGGVDIWGEIIAHTMGIPCDIYLPDERVWSTKNSNKKGFKERNVEIARNCDILYCLDPEYRNWSGAMWTAKYAEEIGKEVYYVKF